MRYIESLGLDYLKAFTRKPYVRNLNFRIFYIKGKLGLMSHIKVIESVGKELICLLKMKL